MQGLWSSEGSAQIHSSDASAHRFLMGAGGPPPPDCTLLHAAIDTLELTPLADDDVVCMTLLEVIEHLDAPWEAAVSELIGRCNPHVVIVTTPNVEFNLNLMANCSTERSTCQPCRKRHKPMSFEQIKRAFDANEICKGCKLFAASQAGAPPPSTDFYPRRNRDHRFEWTRAQFRMWAEGLAADRGYAVRFDGVGGGAWDETRRPDNKLHGPGPSSQMAVFTRCDGHETAVLAPPTAKAMAPPPEPRVVWSSAALNMVTAGTAAMLTAAAHADADEDWVYPPGWGGGASVE